MQVAPNANAKIARWGHFDLSAVKGETLYVKYIAQTTNELWKDAVLVLKKSRPTSHCSSTTTDYHQHHHRTPSWFHKHNPRTFNMGYNKWCEKLTFQLFPFPYHRLKQQLLIGIWCANNCAGVGKEGHFAIAISLLFDLEKHLLGGAILFSYINPWSFLECYFQKDLLFPVIIIPIYFNPYPLN